jgi:hypothetical protein
LTVLTTDGWGMQWSRVERGFAKLSKVYNDTELYDDDVYHFFQDVWHLKDWIKNDPSISKTVRNSIENEVKNVRSFRIAADIANGTKHMELTSSRPENALLTERNVTIRLGDPSATATHDLVFTLADGSKVSAKNVATDVMLEWELLLKKLCLI